MGKPDDIPQDVWDKSGDVLTDVTNDHHCWGIFDGAPEEYPGNLQSAFARAVMAAKDEERGRCIADLLLLVQRHGEPGAVAENPFVDLNKAVAAIRKRGEG